ncbi:DUF4123 domain-containing protein [Marinobacter sp. KMM 10035]|uniref:DUF4123 domain-containing protein n=1 Tax=Marinobacter sp. KMM 10035 TaxID=3134034 RepID=UPI00397A9828
MSMDAAYYINTLETRAPRAAKPNDYDFAVLDLASSDKLLEEIYAGMTNEPIQWWSLFEGTNWQAEWDNGPVLVDLRNAACFRAQLSSRLESSSQGIVFKSDIPVDELREHLSHWLTESNPGSGQLLRFHEPRMFGPLLCVLADQRSQKLLSAGTHWWWHDAHNWRQARPKKGASSMEIGLEEALVSQLELQGSELYWLAGEACGYANYYADSLPEPKAPERWVFDTLHTAQNAGFANAELLERWLRMAIQYGKDFYLTEPVHTVFSNEELLTTDRLVAMESLMESVMESVYANNL